MSAPAPNSEWVEWPAGEYRPKGIRFRKEWTVGQISEGRYYAHRDDLAADPDRELVSKMARAAFDATRVPRFASDWRDAGKSTPGGQRRIPGAEIARILTG